MKKGAAVTYRTLLYRQLLRPCLQCVVEDTDKGVKRFAATDTNTGELVRGLRILDRGKIREWVERGAHVAIVKEIGQHDLLLGNGIIMKWFARGVAEELNRLPNLGFQRCFRLE